MKGLVPLYKMTDEESNFMAIDALFAKFFKGFLTVILTRKDTVERITSAKSRI
jgi:hypothetical protein